MTGRVGGKSGEYGRVAARTERTERLAWWVAPTEGGAEALTETLAALEAALDHLHVGVLIEDERGFARYVNGALCDVFGLNPFEISPPGDSAQVLASYFRAPDRFVVQTRRQRLDRLSTRGELLEARSGAMIERSYAPMSAGGVARGGMWQYRDVSELRRAQRDLRLSEARHRGILSASVDSVIIVDEQGRILEWNRAAEGTFGWSRDEAVGKLLSDLVIPDAAREAHQRLLQRRVDAAQTPQQGLSGQRLEVEAKRRDGRTFPCEMTITRVDVDGRTLLTGYLRDITDRREAEAALLSAKDAAEAANRAKSVFLASMSHEVRTPLNAVLGMTELVLEQPLSPEQRRCLDVVKSSASALQHLMNDLLDLSRIEAERIEIEEVAFSPREVIDHVIQVVRLNAEEKGLRLRSFVESAVPERLAGDPNRLRQVLLNLVSNAVKYTAEGSVTVTLSALVDRRRQTAQLELSVRDTGVGIAPADKERVFERFFRSERTEGFDAGGVGLGLHIARSLVELMGGKLSVESEPGRGSEFFVDLTLPITTEMHRPASGLIGHVSQPELIRQIESLQRERVTRVLLVEDHAPSRMLMERILHLAGYVVESAHNGAEAVALAKTHTFDMILMDVQMPILDGFGAAQQIRDLEADTARPRTPIIALTAHAMQGFRERCLASGMDDYLPKPVDRTRLLSTLSTWARALHEPTHPSTNPSPTPPPPTSPIPNVSNIDDDVLALIPSFISRCLDDVRAMRAALASRDLATIQRLAHNMKGAGAPFGFPEISNMGRELEGALRQQNPHRLQLLIQDLDTFVQTIAKRAL